MKKTLVLGAAVLLLAGCGNKVKCTYTDKDTKNKYTVVGTFKKDDLQKYTMSVKYDDKKDAKASCKSAKSIYDKSDVKCSGKKVTVTYNKPKSSTEKVTKEEFKKEFTSDNFKCK